MTRRRSNDPIGVSETRKVTTDPVRQKELLDEYRRKLKYLDDWYHFQMDAGLTKRNYNASLDRLKKALGRSRKAKGPKSSLHPELELEINLEARKLAVLTPGENLTLAHQPFVDQAARIISKTARKKQGTPGSLALRRVVEGLMAIYLQSTGTPLMAMRDKDSVYDPQLSGPGGRIVRAIVDHLKPGVSDTTLSGWIRDIRKQYAGKSMRFQDLFPGYGMVIDLSTGTRVAIPPHRIDRFIPIMPISCP